MEQQQCHYTDAVCIHIVVSGYVQGVGFRPFVFHLANKLNVKGYVSNNAGQVTIIAEACEQTLEQFCEQLISLAPANAKPIIQSANEISVDHHRGFSIKQSNELSKSDIHILPDLPTCNDCINELFDENNRRYLYPFINCSHCGPRNSIITSLPYDRKNTSMQAFKLCSDCEEEYFTVTDRRFHAEPIACNTCGPVLNFSRILNSTNFTSDSYSIEDNKLALEACVTALTQGEIIAVKGIAGYHLMCDATSTDAVALLRSRKQRPDKPFAILIEESQLDDYIDSTDEEKGLLKQTARSIVLVKRTRNDSDDLADNLAAGFKHLGVMLPSNPLQHLLCHFFKKPLVATSANISGEPIITNNADATHRLAKLCDAILHHNRDIVRPSDDPVMLHNNITQQVLRTGRGITPTEFLLPFSLDKPVLAVGGHIKNTIALAWQNRMVISAHHGNLDNLRSYQSFKQSINDLQQLYQVNAEHIVCDAHPAYSSTRWANDSGLPVTRIFHHHAHASSLMLNTTNTNDYKRNECLMFAWDGIGLGADGSLWGGETFLGYPGHWQRVASFNTFRLPGGEKTARDPWRIAASLCWHANIEVNNQASNKSKIDQLKMVWNRNINCPTTSAAGRLFSAAASLLDLVTHESFEGHGPMLLEALAETAQADAITLPIKKDENSINRIDWRPLVFMLNDNTLSTAQRARCFHETLADCINTLSMQYAEEHKNSSVGFSVGLSGGVFQNQLLLRLIQQRLDKHNINLLFADAIPVNDAGLCAGQIIEYYNQ